MLRALTVVSLALIAGCVNTTDLAKQRVKEQLIYKEVVEYRNIKSFRAGAVCGEVNGTGRWGDTTGFTRFIMLDEQVIMRPEDDAWSVYCSDDPRTVIESIFGIKPVSRSNTTLMLVISDLQALDTALQAYLLADQRVFPSTGQGLAALTNPDAGTANSAPLIKSIPKDPWGQPYQYERLRILHPLPSQYRLLTLGRDGKAGGRAEDADVGNLHVPYLEYALDLK